MSYEVDFDSFEYNGRIFSGSASYEVEWENDGIGSYEYWGAKGFDKGNDYAVVEDYSLEALFEMNENGENIEIFSSDPIFAEVQKAISVVVDSAAERLEPDPDDGDYEDSRDCEPDYD